MFWLRLQALKKVLAPAPEPFGSLKAESHCIIGTTSLLHKLCLLNRNSNFRLRLHHPKIFGSDHPKLLGLRLHSPGYKYHWKDSLPNFSTTLSYVHARQNWWCPTIVEAMLGHRCRHWLVKFIKPTQRAFTLKCGCVLTISDFWHTRHTGLPSLNTTLKQEKLQKSAKFFSSQAKFKAGNTKMQL